MTRALVLMTVFALLAQPAAAAGKHDMLRRCNGPYNCITINTGPCGTFMTNDRNGLTPDVTGTSDSTFPRIEGVCGFYSPPFYLDDRPPPPPEGTQFPPVPAYISPP